MVRARLEGLVKSVFAFSLLFATGVAVSAQSEEAWRVLLEQQLLEQETCSVTFLTNLNVKEEEAGTSVRARAHCEDNRSFDVTLEPGKPRFTISACAPTYC